MTSIFQDARYGFRILSRNPRVSLTAVFTLALGIGASTTIFSVVNGELFRPLPFKAEDRLVILAEQSVKNSSWQQDPVLSTALLWKKQTTSFEQMEFAVDRIETDNLLFANEAERVDVQLVSPALPDLLGLKPVLGRGFSTQGQQKDGHYEGVLIGHGLWRRHWGGDPNVIGKRLETSEGTFTIIGVMPPNAWVLPWVKDAGLWIALDPNSTTFRPDMRWFAVLARLSSGTSIQRAQAEMQVLGRQLAKAHPETNRDWTANAFPLREFWIGDDQSSLYLLMGAVGFVLLIACANVANLLLARARSRTTEMAVRASIGGTRGRIVRQLLTESVTLALIGGALGLALSFWGVKLWSALIPGWFTLLSEPIIVDRNVLAFTLGLAMLTGILFGIAPAVQISGLDLSRSLKEGGVQGGGDSRQIGGRLLVVGEVALTLVLLSGAGLTVNSFIRLKQVDLGFNPAHLLRVNIELAGTKYMEVLPNDLHRVTPAVDGFFQQTLERLRMLPGVTSVALDGMMRGCPFRIAGHADQGAEPPSALLEEVDDGYFRTLEIPLKQGRGLTRQDDELSPWVALINTTMAKHYFPRENPIGQQIYVSFTDSSGRSIAEGQPRQIVGVVADATFGAGWRAPALIYIPHRQHIRDYPGGASRTHLSKTLFLRTSGDPLALTRTVQRVIAEVDRTQVATDIQSMEQTTARMLRPWRFYVQIFGILSGIAIALAAVGIYGVMSYTVSRQAHEIGVRMALGANSRDVLGLILKNGLKMTLPGIAIGLAGAFGLTRLIGSMLYGVPPADPVTFTIVSIVLMSVALAACYFPARQATSIDPVKALRNE